MVLRWSWWDLATVLRDRRQFRLFFADIVLVYFRLLWLLIIVYISIELFLETRFLLRAVSVVIVFVPLSPRLSDVLLMGWLLLSSITLVVRLYVVYLNLLVSLLAGQVGRLSVWFDLFNFVI